MKTYCLTLDLKNNDELIRQYETYHRNIWPEIARSIKASGILDMTIYRYQTRMCMIIKTTDEFSLEAKKKSDLANPKVREWEELMWKFQDQLPGTKPGEKWQVMDKIFSLSEQ